MPLTPAQLGQIILNENPYSTITGAITVDNVVEVQTELGNWTFKGGPHYIERALKLSYTYVDAYGATVRDYILVGYEGGGAY